MSTLDKFVTEDKQHPNKKNMSDSEHIKLSTKGKLQRWLDKKFLNESTKKGYKVELTRFVKAVYGDDIIPFRKGIDKVGEVIQRYLSEERNFLEDFNRYLLWMNKHHYSPRSIVSGAFITRKFFSRHNHTMSDREWEDLATLLPANVPITQDDILTKEQLRVMMNHLYISGRALTLFLVSTGARIGECVQLKIEDLNLDADPPSVRIRAEYTKKGIGKRTVWMSYEARNAIREWLKIKDSMRKRGIGGPFSKEIVFPFTYLNFAKMWNKALERAGFDKRDPKTKHHVYHVHTLRKFFRTQMGIVGVPDMVVHAWMGHKPYLKTYDKLGKKKMAEMYKDHMAAVSVYVSERGAKRSQVIIKEDELNGYLANGWMFMAALQSGKIVVEGKPGQLRPTQLEESKEEKAAIEQPTKSDAVSHTQTSKTMPHSEKPLEPPRLVQEKQAKKYGPPPVKCPLGISFKYATDDRHCHESCARQTPSAYRNCQETRKLLGLI